MPAAQRTFVRIVRHVETFSAKFFRTADIDQRAAYAQDAEAPGRGRRGTWCRRAREPDSCWAGYLGISRDNRPVLLDPLQPPAVHDLGVGVPEQLQHPEGIGGPPIILIAVENDRRLPGSAHSAHQLVEGGASEIVAPDRVVEVPGPVDFHRAGNVIGAIQKRVFVGFGNANLRILQVFLDPVRGNQDIGPSVAALADAFRHADLYMLIPLQS